MAHTGGTGPASIADAIAVVRDLMPIWTREVIQGTINRVFHPDAVDASNPLFKLRKQDFEEFFEARYPEYDLETVVYRILRSFYTDVGYFFRRYQPHPSTTYNQLQRFFIIFLQCGPDRALRAYIEGDDLWDTGIPSNADINYNKTFEFEDDQADLQPLWEELQNSFYGTFRATPGDYDPRQNRRDYVFYSSWVDLQEKAERFQLDTPENTDFAVPLLAAVHDGEPYPTPAERAAERKREKDLEDAANLFAQQQREAAELAAKQKDLADQQAKLASDIAAIDKAVADRAAAEATATAAAGTTAAAAGYVVLDPLLMQVLQDMGARGLTQAEQAHEIRTFMRTRGKGGLTPPVDPATPHPPGKSILKTPRPPGATALVVPAPPATLQPAKPDKKPVRFALRLDPATGSYYYDGTEDDEPPQKMSTGTFAQGIGNVAPAYQGYPARIREQIPQPNKGFDAPIRVLADHGIKPESLITSLTLGISSGVAEGISALVKNKSGPQYRIRELGLPPVDQDCRIDSFDFNIHGKTLAEILGNRFPQVVFPTEGARVAAAHAILQRVVDDPLSPNNTKIIALQELSQIDPPKQLQNQSQMSALEAVRLANRGLPSSSVSGSLIPPPILGNNSAYNTSYLKGLYSSLGMPQEEKFTVGDPTCKPLKFFLPALSSIITSNRLDEEAAYSLLMSITKGDTYFHVRQGKFEDKIPFEEMWITLQKTSSKTASPEGLMKKLEDIFETHPTDLEGALGSIQTCRAKMFIDHPDENERKMFITKSTIQDFTNFIHKFYGTQASGIEATFKNRLAELQLERAIQVREGRAGAYREPNQINLFKEAICAHLSRPYGITMGPSRLFGGADLAISSTGPVKKKAEMHSSTFNSPPESDAYTGPPAPGSNGSNGSGKKNKKNKSGYMKNSNENAHSFYGNQNQGGQQQTASPQSAPTPAPAPAQAAPNQQQQQMMAQQYQPNPSQGMDGQTQGEYLNRGASLVPQICLDQTPRNTCCLCQLKGHWSSKCRLYPNQIPVENKCQHCGGFHPYACKRPANANGNPNPNTHYTHQVNQQSQGGFQGGYNGNRNNNNRLNFNNRSGPPRNGNGNGNGYRGNRPFDPNMPSVRDQLADLSTKFNTLMEMQQGNKATAPAAPRGALLANNGHQNAPDGIYMNPATASSHQPQSH